MANHRCFSKAVIDTDNFLDMPLSAQALYFHFGLNADDDGFLGGPRKIARSVGCGNDDIKLLIAKGFLIPFESGIVVITHWRQHNYIPKDRYHTTMFEAEKAALAIDGNKPYTLKQPDNVPELYTNCIQTDNKPNTEVKLSKDKLSKDKDILSTSVDERSAFDCEQVVNSFNSVCVSLPKVQKLTDTRKRKIKGLVKALDGVMTVDEYFTKVESSDFLSGRSSKWKASFDWTVKPENITKIVEGNYDNRAAAYTPQPLKLDYSGDII